MSAATASLRWSASANGPPKPGEPPGKEKKGKSGGGGGGSSAPNNDDHGVPDPVDEITPRIKIFVAGMFIVSFVLYKLAMPRGQHVGWHSVFEHFAKDQLKSIDIYDSYAEFSTSAGYCHVGIVSDQHTNGKIKALQAHRDKLVAAKLASADQAEKQEVAKDSSEGKGTLPTISYCGTPLSEQLLTAFGVFAWIVPFVFFPTVALILTRAVGTAMAVSANAETKTKMMKKEFIVHTTSNTRFAQVAGMKEAKREVTEIVEFLKNPAKYTRLGAKIPTGALLMGPPGTGKTLLAKAVAGEAGIGFIPVCGSDFVELYVGMGALRVRQLFEVAKQQRCIVYIDEIDAIGLKRQGSGNGEKAEQEHTLNELLTQLDGFTSNRGEIMILASTNVHRDQLDPALIRPGRFDRLVHVDAPVISERIDIFKVHLCNLTLVAPPPDGSAAPLPLVSSAGAPETPAAKDSAVTAERSHATTAAEEKESPSAPPQIIAVRQMLTDSHAALNAAHAALSESLAGRLLLESIVPVLRLLLDAAERQDAAQYNKSLPDMLRQPPDLASEDFFAKLQENLTTLARLAAPGKAFGTESTEQAFKELVRSAEEARLALSTIARCPASGVTAVQWLAFLKRELAKKVVAVAHQAHAVEEQISPAPETSAGTSEGTPTPVVTSPFLRRISVIDKCSGSYVNTISSIHLSTPSGVAATDSQGASSSSDNFAKAVFDAIEAQSATLLQVHISLLVLSATLAGVKSKASLPDSSEIREQFSKCLSRLGEVVLQPAGYELLAPATVPVPANAELSVKDVERKATVQQAYEFDFSSSLAKKSPEEQQIIEMFAKRMSDLCPGFVGADIANVCNEGAILAAREKATFVTISHLERSIDRVLAGIEHRSRRLSDFEKTVVAHHEAGHAVAGWFLNLADPLMKVSIVPRGGSALGYAQYLPNENHLRSAQEILDSICVTLGGRVAEEIFFGHLSTGASDDLSKVTKSAYMYVSSFTASTVRPSPASDHTKFVKPFGSNLSNSLDEKAKDLVDHLYKRTHELLLSKKAEMEVLAKHLLEHEVLTHQDVVRLIGVREERQISERKRGA